jgi:hypothetical protein
MAKTSNNLDLFDCRFLCGLEYSGGSFDFIHGDKPGKFQKADALAGYSEHTKGEELAASG